MRPQLPRSLEEIRGLRAARWTRESTRGQYDAFGPEAQREMQDRSIERLGLVDTGLAWTVAHSGRTIGSTGQWADMMASAGSAYDVLVVGYVSRFARDARTALNARHDLHAAGAAVLFADEGLLTSDEDRWIEWYRETGEAEAYSRRLSRQITQGLAAKWRRHADQAGNPPLGFRRRSEPPRVMEIDPATIGQAIAIFERYAEGSVSSRELALEAGVGYEQVNKMLRNPLYNGWVRRHRGDREERLPAAWRADPPVDDALWLRVEDLRGGRTHGGGRPAEDAAFLKGLIVCVHCGRRIRSNGTMGRHGVRQRIHPDPCPAWAGPTSVRAGDLDAAIAAQLQSIDVDEETEARIRTVIAAPAPVAIDPTRSRIRRRLRELALDHAEGRMADAAYLAESARFRAELGAAEGTRPRRVTADEAIAAIRSIGEGWNLDDPEDRAQLAHLIYALIPVDGSRIHPVELTPWALELGLDQAMSETPGFGWRPRQVMKPQVHTVRVPIAGKRERLAAARRTA